MAGTGGMKREATLLAALLSLLFAAGTVQAACRDPVSADLPVAPAAEAGVSAERIVRLLESLDEARHDIRSLLILRDCRLVLERYRADLDREFNHAVYSVTKSVTATLVGILRHQERIGSLDTPVADLVPRPSGISDANWDKARQISLRNAMQMASGIEYTHDPTGHPIYSQSVDRVMVALRPALVHRPGTHFQYSDGDATLSGAVVAARAGTSLHEAARMLLFDPLQMRRHEWPYVDLAGRYPGGWGLRLRPMDMAKFGQLYLQHCVWNGIRLCNGTFIAEAWASGVSKSYGLHWWLAQRSGVSYYAARGFKGQLVLVFPQQDAVVTMTALLPNADVARIEGQLVDAVVGMTGGTQAAPAAQARLTELQAAGFRGQPSRAATSQDLPRRP